MIGQWEKMLALHKGNLDFARSNHFLRLCYNTCIMTDIQSWTPRILPYNLLSNIEIVVQIQFGLAFITSFSKKY